MEGLLSTAMGNSSHMLSNLRKCVEGLIYYPNLKKLYAMLVLLTFHLYKTTLKQSVMF